MLIFLYFHKAFHAELEGLHAAAVHLATERAGDVAALAEGCCCFFFFRHHSPRAAASSAIQSLLPRRGRGSLHPVREPYKHVSLNICPRKKNRFVSSLRRV